jgi:Uma2 family endonuclease
MLAEDQRYKFTVNEYLSLFEKGVLSRDIKTELINGEIIQLSPEGYRHYKTRQLIQHFLQGVFGWQDVFPGGSVITGINDMPEPDLFVTKSADVHGNYLEASQLYLVVEVGDSTARKDLVNDGKGRLAKYAAAGVDVAWVVDVQDKAIHEFTQPSGVVYQHRLIHRGKSTLRGCEVDVDTLISD